MAKHCAITACPKELGKAALAVSGDASQTKASSRECHIFRFQSSNSYAWGVGFTLECRGQALQQQLEKYHQERPSNVPHFWRGQTRSSEPSEWKGMTPSISWMRTNRQARVRAESAVCQAGSQASWPGEFFKERYRTAQDELRQLKQAWAQTPVFLLVNGVCQENAHLSATTDKLNLDGTNRMTHEHELDATFRGSSVCRMLLNPTMSWARGLTPRRKHEK